jgi:hypothetical protein
MKPPITGAPTWLLFFVSIFPLPLMWTNMQIWSMSLSIACIFLTVWVFAVAKSLCDKAKGGSTLNFQAFKRVLIGGCLYALFQFGYLGFQQSEIPVWNWGLVIIMIGQFWLLYATLFVVNFVSKAIATVERGEPVKFDQYASYFVWLFFFPIGIWFIHQRIRAILVS